MTKVRFAKALGTLLLLFAAAYGPAFLTVALLKLRPFEAAPVIFANFTVTSKIDIFLFQNQSGPNAADQHFFRQFRSSIDLNYSFDWNRNNPVLGAMRYKKPDK